MICKYIEHSLQDKRYEKKLWELKSVYRYNYVISWVIQANTKHLYNICTMLDQRRRRWADVVQMLYKCFVFAGYQQ